MPKFAAWRAEIRCRGRRQASLALAIGVTAVLSAAWLSGDGLERTRRQTAVARATPAQRSSATVAPSNAPLVPPVGAVEETAAADPEPAGRSRRAVAPERRPPSLRDLVRRLETDRARTLAPVLASLRTDGLRGELHNLEAARIDWAAIAESLRTSATLTERRGGEAFFLGGQATLRGFDFRELHANDPAAQD